MATAERSPGFSNLSIENWRQFGHLSIDFHPRLTILTGANATGKSTILGLLGRHFDWMRAYSSSSSSRLRKRRGKPSPHRVGALARNDELDWGTIGQLTYTNLESTSIRFPTSSSDVRTQYDVALDNQQKVTGIYLTSHRAVSGNYALVESIPTLFGNAEDILNQFTGQLRARWSGGWTQKSPQQALKEGLMAAAVFGGGGNHSIEPNEEAAAIWSGYQNILQEMLPKSLGFRRLYVRVPEVIVETDTGDFVLDDSSGGLSAIIEMSWQIFLRSRHQAGFTVLLDEPENHLHPTLQKGIMPSLLSAFPAVQFIVATHSPMVVTATPESSIYALDYNPQRRVEAAMLDYANKAATADETLTRVLGLGSSTPTWAEELFDSIIQRHLGRGRLTNITLRELRSELEEIGLEREYPRALLDVFEDGFEE